MSALIAVGAAIATGPLPAAAASSPSASTLSAAPWHTAPSSAGAASHRFSRAAPQSVHVSALRVAVRAAVTTAPVAPSAAARTGPAAGTRTAGGAAFTTTPSASTPPAQLAAFQGTDQSSAIQTFGTDQQVLPPDPDIAVGPNNVVETTNSAVYVFSRTGTLQFRFDVNAFVTNAHSGGYEVTDPRIIYDAESGRFFFSVLAFSPSCSSPTGYPSEDFIAVSPSSTLSSGDTWNALLWQGFSAGHLVGDQPGLGISDNVVAATQNAYDCSTQAWAESEALMVQKSDLIAGNLTGHSTVDYDNGPFSPQPVQSVGATTVQYVLWNNSDSAEGGNGTVGVSAFSGTPEAQNMPAPPPTVFEPMSSTAVNGSGVTPSASQKGTSVQLQTDDDRFLNAVWINGRIWTAGGTQCTPSGDTAARSCLDIVGVSADSSGTVSGVYAQLDNVGVSGAYLYYPAISVDSAGNVFTVFDESSSSAAESVVVAGIDLAAGGASLTSFATLHTSATYYNPGGGGCTSLGCRWGDYSGAAMDPSHPGDVWVVSEDTDGNNTTSCNSNANVCWNSYIGKYTMSAPDAPLDVSAASTAPGEATLTWTPPADAGPSITGYTITTYDAHRNVVGTTSASASPATVTGLTNGVPYYFGVAAVNAFGTGPQVLTYSVTPSSGLTPPARSTAVSTTQYVLPNSDGSTWQNLDESNVSLSVTPTSDEDVLLSANADLWTWNSGYNQDLGITVNGTLAAWKESGGSAGTFSPNAAFVETVYHMVSSTTYTVKVVWKTSKPAMSASVSVGAGPSAPFSPTRLTAKVLPASHFQTAVSTQQYDLPNSDGTTWKPVDSTNLSLTMTPGASAEDVVLSGNADLWTFNSGYNQDFGIAVSEDGGPQTLVAWKESGGSAGTFSPNAAFVQTVYHLDGGHSYTAQLVWKASRNASGAQITIGAGPSAPYSPTRLTEWTLPVDTSLWGTSVSSSQYALPNSDGTTWVEMDSSHLTVPFSPDASGNVLVSGNVDLWTSTLGKNQDVAVFVSVDGGAQQLVAWKESGGSAGTFSPNAAFVQASYPVTAGHTYRFILLWKASTSASGATIWAGAGPISGAFSPTRLTVAPA